VNFLQRLHNPESRYTVPQLLRWLWRVLKGNRRQTVMNAAIGVIGVGVSLLMVMVMQHTIDVASGAREGSIYWGVAMMGGLILCEFALNILRVWIKNILGVKAQNVMQQQILDRLLRSEWRGKNAYHTGDVINRMEEDVKTVVGFITETLPKTLSVVMMFVGAFFYLLQMDAWLAVTTVGILPLFIAVSRIYVAQMRKLSRRVRTSDSRIQNLLTEAVQHVTLLKTMEAGKRMVGQLEEQQAELRHHVRQRTKFSIVSNLFVNGGFSLGYLIAFLWGAVRLSARTITFGQMTAFLQLVYRIQGPARDMIRLAPAFVSVFTAAERLLELEEVPVECQGEDDLLPGRCGIRLHDVCFTYEESEVPVLWHLSFDFKPGTCTAVLGETGAGKTTLVRLILALMQPTGGHVEIYDEDRQTAITPQHRCNMVYVSQGNTLLSGTIRDNLLLASPHATDEELWQALRMACAEFVADLPQQLDTVCSESGGGLSEGQAQRIAIARALLRNRPIMLFDEATSALDPETEQRLLKQLLEGNSQKTIIFITHRTAVLDYCDQTLRIV
jgi:ABC-type multidrug transport system fused ATPase/permease subunit